MTDYVAGFRRIYLAGLRAIGRQHASVEVAALRQLALRRRKASMAMLQQRGTLSPTVPGGPLIARQRAPRNPLKQEN